VKTQKFVVKLIKDRRNDYKQYGITLNNVKISTF